MVIAAEWRGGAPAVKTVVLSATATAADVNERVGSAVEEWVALAAEGVEPLTGDWQARLAVGAIEASAAVASAALLHPVRRGWRATRHDGRLRSRGWRVAVDGDDRPWLESLGAGAAVDPDAGPVEVDVATIGAIGVRRDAFIAVGGLRDLDLDVAFVDLSLRLRAAGERVVVVPSVIAIDDRRLVDRSNLAVALDPDGAPWRTFVVHYGAALHAPATSSSVTSAPATSANVSNAARGVSRRVLRIAITCAAPSARAAPRWGDWHFAEALGRGFGASGALAHVGALDRVDEATMRACDLHIVLRGLEPVATSPGQRQILWIISHPGSVRDAELAAADLVLCASESFARLLRERTDTPVEVLHQATDQRRFRSRPPSPRHQYDVVIVAKTRGVERSVVTDAIEAGLRPAIYGSGWRRVVDPTLVIADFVPNEIVAEIYASAGVVLNDHRIEMRDNGFVSNRIFDALACGTPVVSDAVAGLDAVFDDIVAVYRSPQELRDVVEGVLGDRESARVNAERGRAIVLAHHTFDHRAARIIELVRQYGLIEPI